MAFSIKTLELNLVLNDVIKYCYSTSAISTINNEVSSTKLDEVIFSLNHTNEVVGLIQRFGRLPFNSKYDSHDVFNSLGLNLVLKVEDFIIIRRFVEMEKSFKDYITQIEGDYFIVKERLNNIIFHKEIMKLIDGIIKDGLIVDNASKELSIIRRNISNKTKTLNKTLDSIVIKYAEFLNEGSVLMRKGRYVLPVKDTYKQKIKGVIHDLSQSKQTIFIEPDEIRQLTQELEYLAESEEKEIYKILTELSEVVKPFHKSLINNLNTFIELDVTHSKALYSIEIKGQLPNINADGFIDLKRARHPLLDPLIAIPIDIKIDSIKPVLMITGPNTGGKTVALKTVGLLTLMIQNGLLIPVDKTSKISVFDHVLADIGDEQSIEQSLSTFSSHLIKIKNMFDQIKGPSLILLDELGSGTDPVEGTALAIAIIDELKSKNNVRLMLTTHYSELKLYAFEQSDILTASVLFDEKTLKPLYRIHLGGSGSSHAITIAEQLGLNKEVIKKAKAFLEGRQTNLAKSLEKLSKEQNAVEQMKLRLTEKEKYLNEETNLYKIKLSQFDKEKEKLLNKIAETELKKYEKLKDKLLIQIDELSKIEALSKPEAALLKGNINTPSQSKSESKEILKVNDHVYIKPYSQDGVILNIKKNNYLVAFGNFELTFKKHDLRKIEAKLEEPKPKTKIITVTADKSVNTELDLRGVRYEEVKELMDKAIDNAMLTNISNLRVIHGFGTGAIRKAVHEYIKNSPHIKSHRYGAEGEGLNGVTIITF